MRLALLIALLLVGCASVPPQPVVPVETPVPIAEPAPDPASTPSAVIPVSIPVVVPPLEILDTSAVSVTTDGATLTITLASGGTWLRLRLPDGRISPITIGPAGQCIGLGGEGAHSLVATWMPGLTVETADSLTGPWTVAARTH
ncbi:hypothetical protein GCM10008957_24550 [Deinococcus ruber]|uniref:Lipoprotein n=1 Tax=Deinococcus ruber TaxID=1848197 RepID=A0A918F6W9_9DEIO|nr:hypothetical protein GCM10008957_24550 [Deinococcus ruber]